jgi:hypothetical protein
LAISYQRISHAIVFLRQTPDTPFAAAAGRLMMPSAARLRQLLLLPAAACAGDRPARYFCALIAHAFRHAARSAFMPLILIFSPLPYYAITPPLILIGISSPTEIAAAADRPIRLRLIIDISSFHFLLLQFSLLAGQID